MWKITKYFLLGLFFLRLMVSIDKKPTHADNQSSIRNSENLILYHAKQLFNDFFTGSVTCHGSHSSHYSHSSHSSHRSHYSSR